MASWSEVHNALIVPLTTIVVGYAGWRECVIYHAASVPGQTLKEIEMLIDVYDLPLEEGVYGACRSGNIELAVGLMRRRYMYMTLTKQSVAMRLSSGQGFSELARLIPMMETVSSSSFDLWLASLAGACENGRFDLALQLTELPSRLVGDRRYIRRRRPGWQSKIFVCACRGGNPDLVKWVATNYGSGFTEQSLRGYLAKLPIRERGISDRSLIWLSWNANGLDRTVVRRHIVGCDRRMLDRICSEGDISPFEKERVFGHAVGERLPEFDVMRRCALRGHLDALKCIIAAHGVSLAELGRLHGEISHELSIAPYLRCGSPGCRKHYLALEDSHLVHSRMRRIDEWITYQIVTRVKMGSKQYDGYEQILHKMPDEKESNSPLIRRAELLGSLAVTHNKSVARVEAFRGS